MAKLLQSYRQPNQMSMKQNFLTIFHSKTDNGGWRPGFQARTFVEPERAKIMNQQFEKSGVKLIPLEKKNANPFLIPS